MLCDIYVMLVFIQSVYIVIYMDSDNILLENILKTSPKIRKKYYEAERTSQDSHCTGTHTYMC